MIKKRRIIEIGTVSSRGQIAIPSKIRTELDLDEGEKIIFVVEGDNLIIKKADKTWEELTKPLRESIKNSELKESDVVDLIHRFRKEKRENENNGRH